MNEPIPMSRSFRTESHAIDMSTLPKPDVIEQLNYEHMVRRISRNLLNGNEKLFFETTTDPKTGEIKVIQPRVPREEYRHMVGVISKMESQKQDISKAIELESEPLAKLIEAAAYEAMLTRQRINDASHSVMLAYAKGPDLDQLGVLFGVERHMITPADDEAAPPVPTVMEDDERFRLRIQMALDGFSTAGPSEAYRFHAFSAHGYVRDVHVEGPDSDPTGERIPVGTVRVTVLLEKNWEDFEYTNPDGSEPKPAEKKAALINLVEEKLNHEDVRPLTDSVIVQEAKIIEYQVKAKLSLYHGPDPTGVLERAIRSLKAHVENVYRLGTDITASGIYAVLQQAGVRNVEIMEPDFDEMTKKWIAVSPCHAASCTNIDNFDADITIKNTGN